MTGPLTSRIVSTCPTSCKQSLAHRAMETHGSYQNLLIQIKHSMCAWSSIHYLSLDLYYHNSICQSNISYSILYIYLRRIWITPIIKRKKCCFCGWLWPDACTFLHLAFAKMENSVRSESCVIRHHDVYEVSKDQKKDKHKTRINKVAHEAWLLGKCSTMRDNPSKTGVRRSKWREWMSTVYRYKN